MTKGLYELVQKVSLFNQLWTRMINMKIGPNKDINLMRTYFILSQNQCDTVLMTYPGQSYTEWNDLDSQGCLSPSEQFGSVWNTTMTTNYSDFHLLSYTATDPLQGVFENPVLGISTPMASGDPNLGLVFGAHFDARSFFKNIIDAKLAGSVGISYLVYDGSQLIYSSL